MARAIAAIPSSSRASISAIAPISVAQAAAEAVTQAEEADAAQTITANYNHYNNYNNGRYGSSYNQYEVDRRQQTKNEWRNLAIGAGLLGVLGLLTKDNTLTFAGAAGSLYSLYRYEQDRKSQSSYERGRAYYFSQPYFYRDGHRFDRRLVTKNGQKYYQFVRQ